MKKILIMLPHMTCGGVEKSLISLLSEIECEKLDITVMLVKKQGEFLDDINKDIKIKEVPIDKSLADNLLRGGVRKSIISNIKQKKVFTALSILYKKLILKDSVAELEYNFKKIKKVEEKYDIAIAYHMHMPFVVKYIVNKVNAEKKYLWMHNDFIETKFNPKCLKKDIRSFDRIFAVSEKVKKEFIDILPEYKDRTEVLYNFISETEITKLSLERDEELKILFDRGYINLVTVCRLSYQKGIDVAIEVCRELVNQNLKVKWTIIGEGEERSQLEEKIRENNLEGIVRLIGLRKNPYKYIKACDIYVQPSRHEGYCLTLAEARILHKPIVTTNFSGANEQIIDGLNGIITECDKTKLVEALKKIIFDENLRKKFILELKKDNIVKNRVDKLNEILGVNND